MLRNQDGPAPAFNRARGAFVPWAAALVAPPAAQRTARHFLPMVLSGRLSLPLVAEVKERNEHKREGGARRRHQDERGEPVVKQMLKQE